MNTNRKKYIASLLGLLSSLSAKAFYQWIIISLVVIAVGTVVVVSLVRTVKHIFPNDNPPAGCQNTVVQIWEDDPQQGDHLIASIGLIPIIIILPYDVTPRMTYGSTNGVAIQYTYNGSYAELFMGTNQNNSLQMISNSTNDYSYVVIVGGYKVYYRNVDGVETNMVFAMDTNVYNFVIERSIDMTSWQSIFTNFTYKCWDINTFIDTNAPISQAYYRGRVEQLQQTQPFQGDSVDF